MFEIIGICVVCLFGWIVLKTIMYFVFPEYGLKVAERRYQEDPSEENENALWKARSRARFK
jgi:hypothetical protein